MIDFTFLNFYYSSNKFDLINVYVLLDYNSTTHSQCYTISDDMDVDEVVSYYYVLMLCMLIFQWNLFLLN